MKPSILFIVVMTLTGAMLPPGYAADPILPGSLNEPTSERTIRGDVLWIEGEYVVVKDVTGHQVRLHINGDSKLEEKLKTGERIEARVTAEGHVISMSLYIPQNGTGPLPPNAASRPSH